MSIELDEIHRKQIFGPVEVPAGTNIQFAEDYIAQEQYERALRMFRESLSIGAVDMARSIARAANWSREAVADEVWGWYQTAK